MPRPLKATRSPGLDGGDVGADRLDDAGAVRAEDLGRLLGRREPVLAHGDVDGVHGRGGDLDEDLRRSGLGRRDVLVDEDLGAAVLVDAYRFHRCLLGPGSSESGGTYPARGRGSPATREPRPRAVGAAGAEARRPRGRAGLPAVRPAADGCAACRRLRRTRRTTYQATAPMAPKTTRTASSAVSHERRHPGAAAEQVDRVPERAAEGVAGVDRRRRRGPSRRRTPTASRRWWSRAAT